MATDDDPTADTVSDDFPPIPDSAPQSSEERPYVFLNVFRCNDEYSCRRISTNRQRKKLLS